MRLVILAWFVVSGIYPFADPGHDMDTFASRLDVFTHFAALAMFIAYVWQALDERG